MTFVSRRQILATLAAFSAASSIPAGIVNAADKIKVAGIYTQPIQQKWDARLHLALEAAKAEAASAAEAAAMAADGAAAAEVELVQGVVGVSEEPAPARITRRESNRGDPFFSSGRSWN